MKAHAARHAVLFALFLLMPLVALLALAACGQSTAAANEVSMAASDFSATSITIKAGQAVHFTDPAGIGGTHIVCLGSDGNCSATAQGPQALAGNGFTINAGDPPKDVTFPTPGTYKITCSIHPSMNLTVTVQ
jgi:plastocyanin